MTIESLDLDSARAMRDNARSIMQLDAFVEWQRQVTGQIEGRRNAMLLPSKNIEGVLETEYTKGEAVGMIHALRNWELLVEQLTEIIDSKMTEEQRESE